MRKILEACPTCGGEFAVSELTCTVCDTVVRSHYSPCPFCRLAAEDLAFLLLFVRNRGNVKEMERELGVSYWTIRGRLNEVIALMGLEPGGDVEDEAGEKGSRGAGEKGSGGEEEKGRKAAILERLRRGELSAEEAAKQLRTTSDE